MGAKRPYKVYYLLLAEGDTEYNLFAYITKKMYRQLFQESNIQFSDKINIVNAGISAGKLNGIGNLTSFNGKYSLIKDDARYIGEKLFFILDKDLDDSSEIENIIKKHGDVVQFIENNSEHLLLRLAGKSPRMPTQFKNLTDFRGYCKIEFQKQFDKEASDLKDNDFDEIFKKTTDKEIRKSFAELFATLEK